MTDTLTPERLAEIRHCYRHGKDMDSAIVRELLRHIDALEKQGQWQPIKTAPKDGTPIIVKTHTDLYGWVYGWATWEGGESIVSGWLPRDFGGHAGVLGLSAPDFWKTIIDPPEDT